MFPFKRFFLVSLAVVAFGCTKDMAVQAKLKPQGVSRFFADQRADRPTIPGTVAMDEDAELETPFSSGLENGRPVDRVQIAVSEQSLKTGRVRYDTYCTPCHDRSGAGDGIIIQRGFPKPVSLTGAQMRALSDGELFRSISFGKGKMAGYHNLIPTEDRWAIVAYVRALQLADEMPAGDLEPADLEALNGGHR